ncbi:Cell division cycle-associated protein 7 [Liparis tanakae]|uniref:Cell division cycle-associated protein 7 n=1 Tax=Liparis tanakae TaxID=230148 RepID=A0A4Z2IY32_9TELE|nr:Cell division cycle-associated protein 7 [Liparis tanakae]
MAQLGMAQLGIAQPGIVQPGIVQPGIVQPGIAHVEVGGRVLMEDKRVAVALFKAGVLGMDAVTKRLTLADVFMDDSENERTFYGFSDSESSDHCDKNSNVEDEGEAMQPDLCVREPEATSKPSSSAQTFRLRVVLRSISSTQQSSDKEEDKEEKRREKRVVKWARKTSQAKKKRHGKSEDEEVAVPRPSPSKECGSDSEEDVPASFLVKREQNIKANKAMRPPRSGAADEEYRKNPERASRRQTRSMGGRGRPSAPKEEDLELTLEELLEVRRSPQRRGTPRPKQCKPHFVRPVEDITEDEIQLVADNMTEKVYNRLTGSTCHQCRQKTVDTKTCCRSEDCRGILGQFCGPCLRNRYGEDVKKALLDPEWTCPPCRGICNCSFCRQREGRCPTGILFPLAQYHGYSDVHSYLSSDGDGNSLQLVHLQPRASECVEIYGLDAWDLHGVDRYSSSCRRTLAKLGKGLHLGQRDLWSCRTLDLNGLPAHLAIGAHSAQEDGACIRHNLKILKPFLTEGWSCKHLTPSTSLDGLEGCSPLDKLLRLDKDLMWLLAVSVVRLYRDTQRRCCVLLECPGHHSIAVMSLSHSI